MGRRVVGLEGDVLYTDFLLSVLISRRWGPRAACSRSRRALVQIWKVSLKQALSSKTRMQVINGRTCGNRLRGFTCGDINAVHHPLTETIDHLLLLCLSWNIK